MALAVKYPTPQAAAWEKLRFLGISEIQSEGTRIYSAWLPSLSTLTLPPVPQIFFPKVPSGPWMIVPAKSRPGVLGRVVSRNLPSTLPTSEGLIAEAWIWTKHCECWGWGMGIDETFKLVLMGPFSENRSADWSLEDILMMGIVIIHDQWGFRGGLCIPLYQSLVGESIEGTEIDSDTRTLSEVRWLQPAGVIRSALLRSVPASDQSAHQSRIVRGACSLPWSWSLSSTYPELFDWIRECR